MGALEQIKALYEYNEWANHNVLEAASGFGEEEMARQLGASYGSIRGNLAHIVRAQAGWYWRWTGQGADLWRLMQGEPSVEAIREGFAVSHKQLREFVKSVSEEDGERVISYVDSRGTKREPPLWQLMIHVVNHGTHHRAETAMALTALGSPVRDLDYVFFELERG